MKKLTTLFSLLCLTLALTVPASALDYAEEGFDAEECMKLL